MLSVCLPLTLYFAFYEFFANPEMLLDTCNKVQYQAMTSNLLEIYTAKISNTLIYIKKLSYTAQIARVVPHKP